MLGWIAYGRICQVHEARVYVSRRKRRSRRGRAGHRVGRENVDASQGAHRKARQLERRLAGITLLALSCWRQKVLYVKPRDDPATVQTLTMAVTPMVLPASRLAAPVIPPGAEPVTEPATQPAGQPAAPAAEPAGASPAGPGPAQPSKESAAGVNPPAR